MVLITIARQLSAVSSRTLGRRHELITYRPWSARARQGAHGKVGVEGASLGTRFYGSRAWGPRVSQAHSMLVNLKQKRENLRNREENKINSPNGELSKLKISKTKEAGWGWGWGSLALYLAPSGW